MAGDRLGAFGRTAGKQPRDFPCHAGLQLNVLADAVLAVAFTTAHPGVLVGEALLFGLLQRGFPDQDALPLVPLTAAAPPHHHGRKHAGLLGPAGQRGVTRAEEHQVIQVSAGHAERSLVGGDQQVAGASALGAVPGLDRQHDHQVGRLCQALRDALLLSRREVGRDPVGPPRAFGRGMGVSRERRGRRSLAAET